jgi:arylsulfatase A-like enzyme
MFDNTNFPWIGSMSTGIRTLGHLLREAGYYTACKRKQHLTKDFETVNKHGTPTKTHVERDPVDPLYAAFATWTGTSSPSWTSSRPPASPIGLVAGASPDAHATGRVSAAEPRARARQRRRSSDRANDARTHPGLPQATPAARAGMSSRGQRVRYSTWT